jgi:DNA repair photolyase
MVILQLFGFLSMTNRKFTFMRCVTPFYYWIASVDEPKKPAPKKRAKAIKTTK